MTKEPSKRKNQTLVEGTVEALQAEVERLKMENAYLKKLNASPMDFAMAFKLSDPF